MKIFYFFLIVLSINVFSSTVVPDKDESGNIISRTDPFYSESIYTFKGSGYSCLVAASVTTNCEYIIPYSHAKFNGINIITNNVGDFVNLKVLDTAQGTYTLAKTGTAIPSHVLNQFAVNWYLSGSSREILPYASDLYQGMRIVVEYKNSEATSKNVYINLYFHVLR